MLPTAIAPALALVAGAAGVIVAAIPVHSIVWGLPVVAGAPGVLLWINRERASLVAIVLAFGVCGAILADDAREEALHPPIRALLERTVPGFSIDTPGPPDSHDPITILVRLTEDA